MFHVVVHFAHARCAKAVSPAGMLHGDGIIDGNVQQRFPLFSLNNFLLSIVVESDVRHGGSMTIPLLSIKDLHVSVEGKDIVRGVDITVQRGEIHAVMGPNGSGKSTLVHALMGHPRFAVTAGMALFEGRDLFGMAPDERARRGLFLAFQYPREIAGVPLRSFLYAAHKQQAAARGVRKKSLLTFQDLLLKEADALSLPSTFLDRPVNVGCSGGEKKKCEILQLRVLRPLLALLDETDSGLDIDALRIVAQGVNALRGPTFSALLVTHYARLLKYIIPDYVHVMVGGRIVESGGKELAEELERTGYMTSTT